MINNANVQQQSDPEQAAYVEAAMQTPEGRRKYGVLAMAVFHADQAMAATYPSHMLSIELEVNGEAPANAEAAARASSIAAHQAIQETIANQRPELN
jgi:hypothetical protein